MQQAPTFSRAKRRKIEWDEEEEALRVEQHFENRPGRWEQLIRNTVERDQRRKAKKEAAKKEAAKKKAAKRGHKRSFGAVYGPEEAQH